MLKLSLRNQPVIAVRKERGTRIVRPGIAGMRGLWFTDGMHVFV